MSAPLAFGTTPIPGTMYLSRYGDFVTEIVSNAGPWPDGTQIEFHFMADNASTWTIWPATITGSTASWNVVAADVATLLTSGVTQYRLFYIQNGSTLEWSSGPIRDVS